MSETIQSLQLETDSTARALKSSISDKEKQLVEHDVLKLQVCSLCGSRSKAEATLMYAIGPALWHRLLQ